jgi:hypothetical protein
MSSNKQGNSKSDVGEARRIAIEGLTVAMNVQNEIAVLKNRLVAGDRPPSITLKDTVAAVAGTSNGGDLPGTLMAAANVTPKGSGQFLFTAMIQFENTDLDNGGAEFFLSMAGVPGAVASGGELTVDGWLIGPNGPPTATPPPAPPVAGGVLITPLPTGFFPIWSVDDESVQLNETTTLTVTGINFVPIKVPFVAAVVLGSGPGNQISNVVVNMLSVNELP